MPYPHRYGNQSGLYPYNDPYVSDQYHMNLANRYDKQQQQQQQTESQQKSIQESSSETLKTICENNARMNDRIYIHQ